MPAAETTRSKDSTPAAEPGLIFECFLLRLSSLKLVLQALDLVLQAVDRVLYAIGGRSRICSSVEFCISCPVRSGLKHTSQVPNLPYCKRSISFWSFLCRTFASFRVDSRFANRMLAFCRSCGASVSVVTRISRRKDYQAYSCGFGKGSFGLHCSFLLSLSLWKSTAERDDQYYD